MSFFIARNEDIRWAQKPKYQKAVSVNRNEAYIPSVNRTETVTALLQCRYTTSFSVLSVLVFCIAAERHCENARI